MIQIPMIKVGFLPPECLIGEKRIHRKEPHSLTTSHTVAATASDFLKQFVMEKMLERDENIYSS